MSKRKAFTKESLERQEKLSTTHLEIHSLKAKGTSWKRRRTSNDDQDHHGPEGSGNVKVDDDHRQTPTESIRRPCINKIVTIHRSKRRLFQVESDDRINLISDSEMEAIDSHRIRMFDMSDKRATVRPVWTVPDTALRQSSIDNHESKTTEGMVSDVITTQLRGRHLENNRLNYIYDNSNIRLISPLKESDFEWDGHHVITESKSTSESRMKGKSSATMLKDSFQDLKGKSSATKFKNSFQYSSNIRLISPLKDDTDSLNDSNEIDIFQNSEGENFRSEKNDVELHMKPSNSESTSGSRMKGNSSDARNLKSSATTLKDSFQDFSNIRLISPLKDAPDSLDDSSEMNTFQNSEAENFANEKNDARLQMKSSNSKYNAKLNMKSSNSKMTYHFQDSLNIRLISPLKDDTSDSDDSSEMSLVADSESESFMRKKAESDAVHVLASVESELKSDVVEDFSNIRLISPMKDLILNEEHPNLESIENEVPRKKNQSNKIVTSHLLESTESTFIDHYELYSNIRLISPVNNDISKRNHFSETNVSLQSGHSKNDKVAFNPWTMPVVNHFNKAQSSASSDTQDEFQVRLISPDVTDRVFDFSEVNKLNALDDKCNQTIIWRPCRRLVFPPSSKLPVNYTSEKVNAVSEKVSKSSAETVSHPVDSREEVMIQFNGECNETDSEKCFAKVVGKQRLSAFFRGSKSENSLDHCFSQMLSVTDDD